MVADKVKATKALALSFRNKKSFGSRFVSFVTAIFLIIVVNVVFGLFTFGSALLLTVPLSFLFTLSIQFVHYYQDNEKKYFVSAGEIVSPETVQKEI